MAKVPANAVTSQMTGKVGDLIFRQHYGQTVAQLRPKTTKRKPSPAQKKGQLRFRKAMAYAKAVLGDPLQRALYQELGAARKQPPNALLIANFLNPPTVDRIELSGYRGQPGDLIKVLASDDIEVVSVTVAIRDANGAPIEAGPAAKIHGVWVYTATARASAGRPLVVEATATDRPGHKAIQTARF